MDLYFEPSLFRDEIQYKKSTTTGEMEPVRLAEPLTDVEVEAVQDLLMSTGAMADNLGSGVVQMADGGWAELSGQELSHGLMVTIGRLSPMLVAFLFSMLRTANWVLIPVGEPLRALVFAADRVQAPPAGFPPVLVVETAEILESELLATSPR